MSELLKLAERCEAASGPDRKLDAWLHCVREELEFVLLAKGGEVYGDICDPSDSGYGTKNTCTPGYLYARYPDHKNPPTLGGGKRGNIVQGCTPDRFTASLDAATTLVLEGWEWEAGSCGENQGPWATVTESFGRGTQTEAGGATPTLALCAAALRARAAVESQP